MHILVICARRYNGHELWVSLGTLTERGHTFEVVSTDLTIRDELSLQPNTIDRLVTDVAFKEAATFDGIMVVSGNMQDTEAYWKDAHVHGLLEAFDKQNKPIAAICCSVPTTAPVAKGKKVSFFPLIRSRERLTRAGAILQTVAVTADKNLVTAEHQMATQVWVDEFCNMLEGKPSELKLKDSGFVPRGRPRRLAPEIQAFVDSGKKEE